MKALPLSILAPLVLSLAGCNQGKAPDQATAGGELLPRSTTDEMLPYDTVQSMPSLAPPEEVVEEGPGRPRAMASGSAGDDEGVVVDAAPVAAAGE